MRKTTDIPIHDFSRDDSSSIPFRLITLEYKTGYDISEAHRHNYYEVFYFIEGGGSHMVDFDVLPIHPGSIHLVSPGQIHHVRRAAQSSGYVILFSRDFLLSTIENKDMLFDLPFFTYRRGVAATLSPEENREVQALLRVMQTEYTSGGRFREDILRSYLNVLLLKYAALVERQHGEPRTDSTAVQLVNRFKAAVEKNFTRQHQVSDYAGQLAVTPNHLNDMTKKVTGGNASDLIHERLVLEARRLLLHSALTTKEIAAFLHFQDPSYFSRFFRKYTGQSPSGFREAVREKYRGEPEHSGHNT